jgi:hypothetical protein
VKKRLDVPNHTTPPHLGPPGLELRLDQNNRLPFRTGERQRSWECEPDADERDIANDQTWREWELAQRAHVGALEHGYLWMRAQPFVQLPVTHVQGGDPSRPALEQDVREPARGRADV